MGEGEPWPEPFYTLVREGTCYCEGDAGLGFVAQSSLRRGEAAPHGRKLGRLRLQQRPQRRLALGHNTRGERAGNGRRMDTEDESRACGGETKGQPTPTPHARGTITKLSELWLCFVPTIFLPCSPSHLTDASVHPQQSSATIPLSKMTLRHS